MALQRARKALSQSASARWLVSHESRVASHLAFLFFLSLFEGHRQTSVWQMGQLRRRRVDARCLKSGWLSKPEPPSGQLLADAGHPGTSICHVSRVSRVSMSWRAAARGLGLSVSLLTHASCEIRVESGQVRPRKHPQLRRP